MTRATTYAIRLGGRPGSPPTKPWRLYTGICGLGELPTWFSDALDVVLHARYDHREDASVLRQADLVGWLQELPPFAPPTSVLDFVHMCGEELEEPMRIRLFLEHLLRELAWVEGADTPSGIPTPHAVVLVRRE
jgi:hypothetical protein